MTNLSSNLGKALSIDLVENFGSRIKTLEELLGINRVIPMSQGTVIKTYTSEVTLDGTTVEPGEVIPLSQVKLESGPDHNIEWVKKRKAVSMEDIQRYGFEQAINITDTKLIGEIQKGIRDKLINQLSTGTGVAEGIGLQDTLAQNWAVVTGKFDEDDVEIISFINPVDAANYLGQANITTQNAFGMNYVEDFLNNKIVFMHGSVPAGTVYSTASENLIAGYVQMSGGEVEKAFDFSTDSSGIIGVTHDVNKQRLTAETIAAYGMVILAERIDGVVVGTIGEALP